MYKLLFTLTAMSIYIAGYPQKIEDLKKKSESHSRGSGGNLDNNSSEPSTESQCLSGCLSSLFSINAEERHARQAEREAKRVAARNERLGAKKDLREEKSRLAINSGEIDPYSPFETFNLSARGSFYPSNYHIWIPEISGNKGHFSYSARFLTIAERRLDKVDYYSTFDFQPLQINFINQYNVQAKIGIGGMVETFSRRTFFEFTTNVNWRMRKKTDMGIEGRMAIDHGIIRQEASMHFNYAFWQKNNKQLLAGLNGMFSEYYQAVDFKTLSLSVGYRF